MTSLFGDGPPIWKKKCFLISLKSCKTKYKQTRLHDRDHMWPAKKAQNIYYLAFYKKVCEPLIYHEGKPGWWEVSLFAILAFLLFFFFNDCSPLSVLNNSQRGGRLYISPFQYWIFLMKTPRFKDLFNVIVVLIPGLKAQVSEYTLFVSIEAA